MIIREFAKPVTAASLNESLSVKFGSKLQLEKFTLAQLHDARNKLRTKLRDVETMESFDGVHSDTYQRSKIMIDVLNAEISERECVEQVSESRIDEGEEDKAELVVQSRDMVDRVSGWMEDTAEMQTETMLDLADKIRDELGLAASEEFVNLVRPALEQLFDTLEITRTTLARGVGILTGDQEMSDTIGVDDMDIDDADADMQDDDIDVDDDFGAASAATGGKIEAGREKRESKDFKNSKKK